MGEHIFHGVLLALHNIALVGCAAAPFYNRNLVVTRGQYGPSLHYKLDKVVEDTLQNNAPYCIVFIVVLFVTGIGMPLNHYLFTGVLKQLHIITWIAISLKLIFIFGMMVIMAIIFFKINPELRDRFIYFSEDDKTDPICEKEFFALRARRKALCEICLIFAIGVLISSAFIGYAS